MKTLSFTSTTEYSLLDHQGKTIAMGSQDQMFGYIKHHVPDGRYRIVGPELRLHCLRENGIVMPDPDGVCLMPKAESEDNMTKSFHEECQKTVWAYTPNQFRTHFVSPFKEYEQYIGKPFVVLGPDKEATKELEEFEYMYKIRFEDGTEITAWGEEVCVAASDPVPVPDSEIVGESPNGRPLLKLEDGTIQVEPHEIVGESPDGRPILKLEDGTFQVQPHDGNYWISIETLEGVQEAYQHPEKYPNPWDTPMKRFSTGIIRCG